MRRTILVSCLAIMAAGFASAEGFQNEAQVNLTTVSSSNIFSLSYTYYLEPVTGQGEPLRLQPFIQQASYVGGSYTDVAGNFNVLTAFGRYMIPDTVMGAAGLLSIIDGNFFLSAGGDAYLSDSLAAEVRIEIADGYFALFPGARYVMPIEATDAVLEIFGGIYLGDESGIVLDGRYFFDKNMFAGLQFTTDSRDLIALTAGITMDSGFVAEAALGRQFSETFISLTAGLRF